MMLGANVYVTSCKLVVAVKYVRQKWFRR